MRRATEVDRRGAIAIDISIHALREESDWAILNLRAMEHEFQSTLSVRRATYPDDAETAAYVISIHALREESDHRTHAQTVIDSISIHALREESDSWFLYAWPRT